MYSIMLILLTGAMFFSFKSQRTGSVHISAIIVLAEVWVPFSKRNSLLHRKSNDNAIVDLPSHGGHGHLISNKNHCDLLPFSFLEPLPHHLILSKSLGASPGHDQKAPVQVHFCAARSVWSGEWETLQHINWTSWIYPRNSKQDLWTDPPK